MTTKQQQASDKHRRSGFLLIVLGLIGALIWFPLGLVMLAGIGEIVYAMSLRESTPVSRPVAPSAPSLTERLDEIDALHAQGRIDVTEHARLRAQLLPPPEQPPAT